MRNRKVYIPKFKGEVEGYVVNFVRRNYWRVAEIMEKEDVMQEALFIFLKLQRQYNYIDNAAWFMGLFKVAFSNHFNDLSNTTTRQKVLKEALNKPSAMSGTEEGVESILVHEHNTNEGYFVCIIEQAPKEVRAVLSLLATAPTELLEEVTQAWRVQGRYSPEGKEHLSKLLGYDAATVDLIQTVVDYFLNN